LSQALVLNGVRLAEGTGDTVVPGRTYGWAPAGSNLIAYADPESGALTVMDSRGRRIAVESTRACSLPAWSDDASRIAFLEKTGRSTYTLMVVKVGDK
jgi:hypothetical protein